MQIFRGIGITMKCQHWACGEVAHAGEKQMLAGLGVAVWIFMYVINSRWFMERSVGT